MRRLMRAAITVLVLHTEDVTQGTAPEIHSGNKWIPREAFTTERQYQSSKPEISAGSQQNRMVTDCQNHRATCRAAVEAKRTASDQRDGWRNGGRKIHDKPGETGNQQTFLEE